MSDYTSITGYYGRATEGSEQGTWTFGNPLETYPVYSTYIRMFIPPGTIVSDFDVLTYDVSSATSRHQRPPDNGYTNDTGHSPATLTEVTDSNCTVHLADEGVLYPLASSDFGGIGIERAGWYYVNMGPKGSGPVFTQQFIAKVDAVKYNAWFDTYIKDEAGWNTYIENVVTYVPPQSNASEPQVVTLTNTTGSSSTFSVTYPEGFSGDWAGGTLAVNASQDINVVFAPTEAKDYTGYIVFSSPNGNCRCEVFGTGDINSTGGLTGSVTATITKQPVPVTCDAGDFVTFSIEYTGTTGPIQWFKNNTVIPNSDTTDLIYHALYVDNGATVYCLVGGAKSNRVTLTVNDYVRTKNVTVTNPTSAEYNVQVVYPNGFTGNWAGGPLGAGASTEVEITFTPTIAQEYEGNVVFTCPSGAMVCEVSGTGIIEDGTEPTYAKTVTVTNTTIADYELTVNCPECFISDWPGGILAAGEKKTVIIAFEPTETKFYSGNVYFSCQYGVAVLAVSGTGSTGSTTVPGSSGIETLTDMSDEYAAQAVSKGLALENLTKQIAKLTDMKALVENATPPNASAELFMDFHLAKVPGSFGSYGLDEGIAKLGSLKTSLENDIAFCTTAAILYSAIDKGIDPGTVAAPPGYEAVVSGSTFSNDKDNPASKTKLEAGPDYHLQNRKFVDKDGKPSDKGTPVYPKSSKVGDLIFVNGILHAYYECTTRVPGYEREFIMKGFYPVNTNYVLHVPLSAVLPINVFGVDTEEGVIKIGDGSTSWDDLIALGSSGAYVPTGGE